MILSVAMKALTIEHAIEAWQTDVNPMETFDPQETIIPLAAVLSVVQNNHSVMWYLSTFAADKRIVRSFKEKTSPRPSGLPPYSPGIPLPIPNASTSLLGTRFDAGIKDNLFDDAGHPIVELTQPQLFFANACGHAAYNATSSGVYAIGFKFMHGNLEVSPSPRQACELLAYTACERFVRKASRK